MPAGVETGCVHGPAWYVTRLAYHLQQTATVPNSTLADGLAAAIDAVRGDHQGRCDLEHSNTPAATAALVRAAGGQLEHLVLCEAHILIDLGDRAP